MSNVYIDLIKAGISEESATDLDSATRIIKGDLATRRDLAELKQQIAESHAQLAWKVVTAILTAMVGLTAIFAAIVGLMVTR